MIDRTTNSKTWYKLSIWFPKRQSYAHEQLKNECKSNVAEERESSAEERVAEKVEERESSALSQEEC